jgi:hypothetical protein
MAAVVVEVSTAAAGEVFTQEAVQVFPAAPTRAMAADIMDTAARTVRADIAAVATVPVAITVVDIMATAEMVIMAADIMGMVDMAGMAVADITDGAADIGATRDMDGAGE